MAIRTPEQLQRIFQASRERKQKQRQRQRLDKQADRLLKQAIRDEKRKRMEQLQALAEKCRQKPLKWTVTEFYISNNKYIEKDADGIHYYQTREELKQAEERGEGKINWILWDRLISETRKELGL